MRHASLVILGMLFVPPPVGATQLPDGEKSTIRTQIEAEVQTIIAGMAALDCDKVHASASPSPDYRMVGYGTVFANRGAALTLCRDGYSQLRSLEAAIVEQYTTVLSHDLAIYTAHGTTTWTNKSSERSPVTPWAWTILWRREAGTWKYLNFCQSLAQPLTP